ncbi:hypothetical protein CPAR01_07422 [Colletotrichum paranaense]|uniref:Uncharacterized protein n=1 Tax=Colletotrichum paranaense TaxID=1914294 RepID=A0ABQ9SPR0_9PEZI|nr:uncharacterized protein CPAR01_07422 [Colletotrichum paranaense]KAK1541433.1 hypothetical protein CPAR01_07422 [Colletotrichum paranaense]
MIVASLRLRTRTLEGGTDLLNPAMLQATQQLVITNFYDRALRSSHPMSSAGLFSFKRYTRVQISGTFHHPAEPASGTSPRIPCSPSLVDVRPLHCRFAADLLCVTKLRVYEGRKSVLEIQLQIPATGLVEPPNQKSGRRGTSTSRSGRIRRGFDAVGQARPPGRAVSRKGVLAARVQTGLTMTWDRMPTPLQGGLPSSMSNVKTQLTESAA